MQSSTGQYSTHAGEPAQPVQHSVMTASSFGFFLRAVVIPLERGSYFCSSVTIILSHYCLDSGLPCPAWHPSPSRLSSPSRHARAREALADLREIIVLSRGRMHEFVVHRRGHIKELVHAAIRELQLQSPKGIRILMVSDFGYAVRGNGDPIHLLRAPFRCGDSSSGRLGTPCPVAALVSTLVFGLFFLGCTAWFVARRVLQQPDSNAKFPS